MHLGGSRPARCDDSSRRDRITIDAGGCKGNPTDTVTFMRGLLIELTAQDAMTLGFGFDGWRCLTQWQSSDGALRVNALLLRLPLRRIPVC
jgi:hypothetical protein